LARVLSDPDAMVIVVEHLEAAAAQGRRIVVADPGETADGLLDDMIEVLTSMCARLCGRRGARTRAIRAITATKTDSGEAA
jgi:putative resolvase